MSNGALRDKIYLIFFTNICTSLFSGSFLNCFAKFCNTILNIFETSSCDKFNFLFSCLKISPKVLFLHIFCCSFNFFKLQLSKPFFLCLIFMILKQLFIYLHFRFADMNLKFMDPPPPNVTYSIKFNSKFIQTAPVCKCNEAFTFAKNNQIYILTLRKILMVIKVLVSWGKNHVKLC